MYTFNAPKSFGLFYPCLSEIMTTERRWRSLKYNNGDISDQKSRGADIHS